MKNRQRWVSLEMSLQIHCCIPILDWLHSKSEWRAGLPKSILVMIFDYNYCCCCIIDYGNNHSSSSALCHTCKSISFKPNELKSNNSDQTKSSYGGFRYAASKSGLYFGLTLFLHVSLKVFFLFLVRNNAFFAGLLWNAKFLVKARQSDIPE